MTGATISTVSTIGISLSSTAANPVSILSTGGINVTSGLYALSGDSLGFFVPGSFYVSNLGASVTDTAPGSFGVTLAGGGTVRNLLDYTGLQTLTYYFGTISGAAAGVAISDGPGTVSNDATIQATATSGVGVSLSAGGTVTNSDSEPKFFGPFLVGVIKGGASAAAVGISGGRGTVMNDGGSIGGGANVGVYLGTGGYVMDGNFPANGAVVTRTGTISGAEYGILVKGGSALVNNNAVISGSQFGVVIAAGPSTVINSGTISGSQFGVMITGGPATVDNSGVIEGATAAVVLPAGYANRLRVDQGTTFDGSVNGGNTVGAVVGSTLETMGGTLSGLGGTITNFSTISFDAGAQSFLGGNTAGIAGGEIFTGFAIGDTINITGVTGETIAGFNANTLTLGGTTPLSIVIKESASATAANFQVSNDPTNGTDIITNLASQPCFAAGTHILTDRGEVAVERIRVGDRIVTAMTGGAAPVVWIGRRRVRPRRHPRPETVQPVMIRPDAFGPGLPRRVPRLSPDHAVFFEDVLIPVGLLVNGRDIVREDVSEVIYYHLRLPEHDVLYAERLPCESYLATGDVAAFDNGGGIVALHPAFAPAAIWETMGCAPLIKSGPRLVSIRARLNALRRDAVHRTRSVA